MRQVQFPASVTIRLADRTRLFLEKAAACERKSLADVARELINYGIEARGGAAMGEAD